MGRLTAFVLALALGIAGLGTASAQTKDHPIAIVIHGGAGTIERAKMTPEKDRAYRAGLTLAIQTGYAILERGGTSLDAVEATIRTLEDDPHFNAGKGAVFTADGTNELDSSIMDGATLKAGAVAGLEHIKNPISLARMVMERSPHVMMVGDGAERFAKTQGVPFVSSKYFFTPDRWQALQDAKRDEALQRKAGKRVTSLAPSFEPEDHRFGTVGCVAVDRMGNIAAGTSTGGTTNKRFGRVGDSPVIGAGTYANNATCGVSATGTGEYFIRAVVAHDISALMEYGGLTVQQAAERVVSDKLVKMGGDGGVIAMDRAGNIAMVFNTSGMYRAYVKPDGTVVTAIYKDER